MIEGTIFICDDEEGILRYLKKMLEGKGLTVETFNCGGPLLDRLESGGEGDVSLLLLDVRMPDMDGIAVLKRVKKLRPELPVVIMTAYGAIENAVEAIKFGAYDYVTKPFPKEKILGVLENALEREFLLKENRALKEELNRPAEPGNIIFKSGRFREVYDLTLQVAGSHANILVLGESGTGKELIAGAIHDNSPRRGNRFVSINCAALSDTLLESQLFGHVRGAFTGAVTSQKGLLEEADGGTLFLDEIGDMPQELQTRLLRVLSDGHYYRVGGHQPLKANVVCMLILALQPFSQPRPCLIRTMVSMRNSKIWQRQTWHYSFGKGGKRYIINHLHRQCFFLKPHPSPMRPIFLPPSGVRT